jgi:hypothetical protein
MGLMRFIVAPPDRIKEEMIRQAYLSGIDRVPWHVRVRAQDNELWLERAGSDSGNLHVPWFVEGRGELMLSTATLRERPEPYYLPLELARGKLTQVRNQLANWQAVGMEVPAKVHARLTEAIEDFGEAACTDHESPQSVQAAERALAGGRAAAPMRLGTVPRPARAGRRLGGSRIATVLGADLGSAPLDEFAATQFLQTFSAANVPMVWRDVETGEGEYFWDVCDRQIEWCRANGLAVCAGPLIDFDERRLPDWLHVCDGDYEGVLAFATEYLESAVGRYRGRVDYWLCAGGANTANLLSLSEEEVVRLTARAVEVTHAHDPHASVLVSFDQPWGEYLSRQPKDFPPLQFADALLRTGLGMNAVALEINLGYRPGGSAPRDLLEFSEGIDYWGLLGVPLFIRLTYPSGAGSDPLALCKTSLPPGDWTPAGQQAWIERYVPLLLSKPLVQGIFWSQLRDAEPHPLPHGGLFDLRRHPKPALRRLASLRQAHLR